MQRDKNMQLHNKNNVHSHNLSSVANGDNGSSLGQGSFTNDSSDGSPAYGATSQDYFMNGSANVSPVYGAALYETAVTAAAAHSATMSATTTLTGWSPPASTMVGSPNGLQFDLTWDSSVASAPPGFIQAVTAAAKAYTELFSNKEVINLDIGYGEVANIQLPADYLGATLNYFYGTDYSTVTTALGKDGFTFAATNEPTSSQLAVTSADAKTLGIPEQFQAYDAYIGFSTLSTGLSYNTTPKASGLNSGTGPNQVDLQAVAEHEISEAMGRVGSEFNLINAYTPLDLFNYQSPSVLDLSANGGYFSVNDGKTNLGSYNNATVNGGDIADWASSTSITQSNTLGLPKGSYDAYDAFVSPGYNGNLSVNDIIEDVAMGYKLKSAPAANAALLVNYIASSFAGAASLQSEAVVTHDVQAPNQQPLLSHPHT